MSFPDPSVLESLPNPMDFGLQLSLVSFAAELLRSGRADEAVAAARAAVAQGEEQAAREAGLLG